MTIVPRHPLLAITSMALATLLAPSSSHLSAQQPIATTPRQAVTDSPPTIVVRPTLTGQAALNQCVIDLKPASDGQGYVLNLEVPPAVNQVELTPRTSTRQQRQFQIRMEEIQRVAESPANPNARIRSVNMQINNNTEQPPSTEASEPPTVSPAVDRYYRSNPFFEAELIGTHVEPGPVSQRVVATVPAAAAPARSRLPVRGAVWHRLNDDTIGSGSLPKAASGDQLNGDQLNVSVAAAESAVPAETMVDAHPLTPAPATAESGTAISVLEPLAPAAPIAQPRKQVPSLSGVQGCTTEWTSPWEVSTDQPATYCIEFEAAQWTRDEPVALCLNLPPEASMVATDHVAKIYDQGRTVRWEIEPLQSGESIKILYQLKFESIGDLRQQLELEQGTEVQRVGEKTNSVAAPVSLN